MAAIYSSVVACALLATLISSTSAGLLPAAAAAAANGKPVLTSAVDEAAQVASQPSAAAAVNVISAFEEDTDADDSMYDADEASYALFQENYVDSETARLLRAIYESRRTGVPVAPADQETIARRVDALARRELAAEAAAASVASAAVGTRPPMYYKKYFDYLPATDAVELEQLDVDFEPLVPLESEPSVQLVDPVPVGLDDIDAVAVNHRSKRHANPDQDVTGAVRSTRSLYSEHQQFVQRQFADMERRLDAIIADMYSRNPWSRSTFLAGPSNVYLPAWQPSRSYLPSTQQHAFNDRKTPNTGGRAPHTNEPRPATNTQPSVSLVNRFSFPDDDDTNTDRFNRPVVTTVQPARGASLGSGVGGRGLEPPPLVHNADVDEDEPPRPLSGPGSIAPAIPADGDGAFDASALFAPPAPAPSFAQRSPAPARRPDAGRGNAATTRRPSRTTTMRPTPGRAGQSWQQSPSSSWSNAGGNRREQPPPPPPPGFHAPPTQPPRVPATASGSPGYCVLAIVNCCDQRRPQSRQACFERYGCGGPIWDEDRCGNSLRSYATNAVDSYFSPL